MRSLINFLTLLVFLCGCVNTDPPVREEPVCSCPIDPLDQISEQLGIQMDTIRSVNQFDPAIQFDLPIAKEFIDLSMDIKGQFLRERKASYQDSRKSSSDFSDDSRLVDLAIARNAFCASIVYCCQNEVPEKGFALLEEFRTFVQENILKKPLGDRLEQAHKQEAKSFFMKVIHGSGVETILVDNEFVAEIPGKSDAQVKTFEVKKGNHVVKIIYLNGSEKEKRISLNEDVVLNHRNF